MQDVQVTGCCRKGKRDGQQEAPPTQYQLALFGRVGDEPFLLGTGRVHSVIHKQLQHFGIYPKGWGLQPFVLAGIQ